MRKLAVLVATCAAFIIAPASANAVITDVLDGDLTCGVVTVEGSVSSSLGQRWCGSQPGSITSTVVPALPTDRSTHKTFDDVPLDVNVAFPADPNPAADTDWPVVGMYHGYGGSKMNFNAMQRWLDKGYAVFSITNRGSGESCQSAGSQSADPTGCANGYVHLMDPRFEIRDAQNFLGELVDENVISPNRIAATGGSYGGSESLHFGVLKNRMTNPDGTLSPWTSPLGEAMSTAVATPNIPWSDLIQALAPNGDTLDYLKDGSYNGKFGIMKESFVQGLYASARVAPIGQDPSADLAGWFARLNQGEPYPDATSDAITEEITQHHSAYYSDHSQAPAPLLLSPGFTDDLFPVDEVIRYYNRTRAQYPNTPMSIFAGSFGHQRGQNQANVTTALRNLENDWVDYYLKDIGTQPPSDVTAYTQTCPNGDPGGGPFNATDWASLAPGELVLKDAGAAKTITPGGGSSAVSALFNPLGPGNNACTTATDAVESGSATYDLDAAPAGGYTVLGSATVVAKITVENGPNSQIAARLVDLDGAGNKTLISRGTWRPDASGFQVFQLHPGAWKVEEGHKVRLELLPKDAKEAAGGFLTNYARPSDDQKPVTIDQLELRVPVVEAPGALSGLVKAPEKKVLPARDGAELAPGYEAIGSETVVEYGKRVDPCPAGTTGTSPPDCVTDACPTGQVGTPPDCTDKPVVGPLKMVARPTVKGKKMRVNLLCSAKFDRCNRATIVVRAKGKVRGFKKPLLAKFKRITVNPGRTKRTYTNLTGKARKIFRNKTFRKKGKKMVRQGARKVRANIRINGKKYGVRTVLRIGKVR